MAYLVGLGTFLAGGLVLTWFWARMRAEYFIVPSSRDTQKRWRGPKVSAVPERNTPPRGVDAGFYRVLYRYEIGSEDVGALLIDLARRGFLRIEQVAAPDARGRGGDWSLTRREVSKEARTGLRGFERALVERLFAEKTTVRIGALRRSFGPDYVAVQNMIYGYLVREEYFHREPLDVKVAWRRAASMLILASALLWALLRASVAYPGAVALGTLALGIATAVLSNFVGARTAWGSAATVEGAEFQRFLQFGTPALAAGERVGVYSRYLPYALVFGVASDWARTCDSFDDPAVMEGALEWFGVPRWTIEQVTEVSAEEFTGEVQLFFVHLTRVIKNSKAAPARKP